MTITEKKEILKQFAQLDLYINGLIADQNYLSSILESLIKSKNSVTDTNKYKECLAKIDAINIKTQEQIDKLCDLKERILNAVNCLDNITERSVLWLHYVGKVKANRYQRLTLWQIAEALNYSEVRIKQLHKTALEKLKL